MNKTASYTKLEKKLTDRFRSNLMHAESTEDVKKFFFYTVRDLLSQVTDEEVALEYEHILLVPEGEPDAAHHYRLHGRVTGTLSTLSLWGDTDLPAIIERFALKAAKYYKHQEKHPEKTESKILHLEGRRA